MATRKIKTAYGWREMNEACWGIDTYCLVGYATIDDETGEIDSCDDCELPGGTWFAAFADAKRAAITHFRRQEKMAKYAIKELRALKKTQITTTARAV